MKLINELAKLAQKKHDEVVEPAGEVDGVAGEIE